MELINWKEHELKGIKKMMKKLINKIRGKKDVYDLIKCGMKVGEHFWVGDNCTFDTSFCYLIQIGNNVTFSNNVQLITHDSSLYDFIHRTKLGMIIIDDWVFIGARTLILPGVHIGEGAIVAAGSLVTKNIPSMEVWGGDIQLKNYVIGWNLKKNFYLMNTNFSEKNIYLIIQLYIRKI